MKTNQYSDVVLIFPPQWSVLQPYLGLPSLTAYLRREGITVNQYDLNIDFFHEVLSAEFLEPMCAGLRDIYNNLSGRSSLTPYEQSELYRIFLILPEFDSVLVGIEDAKRALQSDSFYNIQEKSQHYSLINTAFNIINLFCYVKVSLDTMDFPVDTDSLDEVIKYIRPHRNRLLSLMENQVKRVMSLQKCKVAGISLNNSTQFIPALAMAAYIKENYPDVHVTIGGNLLTRCVEGLINRKDFFDLFADSVVLYEGEKPLLELIRAVKAGEPLDRVPNLLYADKEVLMTPRCQSPDINSLPTPDFDGLDFNRYFSPRLIIPLLTSRGCYWGKCTFCDHSHIYGNNYQERKASLVVDDIRTLGKKYATNKFTLADEAISPQAAKKLSEEILRSGINVRMIAQARLEAAFSEDICNLMYRAGFRWAFTGLESGSDKILRSMNKGINAKSAREVISRFHHAGILVHVFMIAGFPGETEQDHKDSNDFILTNLNCITSVGEATFSVGRYSQIGRNPSMHGIRILPSERDDTFSYAYDFEYLTGQSRSKVLDQRNKFSETVREKLNLGYLCSNFFREQLFLYTEHYKYPELISIEKNYQDYVKNLVGITRGTEEGPGPELKPRLRKGNYLVKSKFDIVELVEILEGKTKKNLLPEDSWILYNFYGLECIRLNASAGYIISLCDSAKSIEQISREYSQSFKSNIDNAREIVLNFFNDFKINRLFDFSE